jgi:hypothetical protein
LQDVRKVPSRSASLARTVALGIAAVVVAGVSPPAPTELAPFARHRGLAWVAGREAVTAEDVARVAELHVDWIAQTPFGWQESPDSTAIRLATAGNWWGEADAGVAATTRLARARGVRTLLKPHLWLRAHGEGQWVGSIAMADEAAWRAWFDSYRRFILHYAALAARQGIEALAVGTELHTAARDREADWRRLIAEVRAVYPGELTYCANWHREYEDVRFWDALDWIGVQAYFPLAAEARPSLAALERGWQAHLPGLQAIAARYRKPVVFTEIGYRSTPDAATRPWEWPERSRRDGAAPDAETQARCYEAFFRAVWDRPWFGGAYFWKWYPRYRAGEPGRAERAAVDFTPQGKPAAEVLRRYYGAAARGRTAAAVAAAPGGR